VRINPVYPGLGRRQGAVGGEGRREKGEAAAFDSNQLRLSAAVLRGIGSKKNAATSRRAGFGNLPVASYPEPINGYDWRWQRN
jgi:hypothetical protein